MTEPAHKLPYFGRPPARDPQPVTDVPALRGKRVILSTPEGFVYDVRAASEIVSGPEGDWVWVVSEVDWFRWMLLDKRPTFKRYPVALVYAE